MSHFGRSPSYLTRHKQVWYFRISVPADLRPIFQKTELRISLGTPYLREARPAARKLAVETQLTFMTLRNGEHGMGGMTREQMRSLAVQHLRELLDDELELRLSSPHLFRRYCREEGESFYLPPSDAAAQLREELAEADYGRVRQYLPEKLERMGVEVDPKSWDFRLLCHEFLLMDLKACEIMERREHGDFEHETQVLASLEPTTTVNQPLAVNVAVQPEPPTEPLISILVSNYISEKMRSRDWKREKDFKPILDLFAEAVGDPPINQLTPEMVRDFRKLIQDHYPRNWKKSKTYRDKSLSTLRKAPIPSKDLMSDNRINFYFITINSFLSWARAQAYTVNDSLTGILTHKVKKDKAAHEEVERFSGEDLELIFHSEPFIQDKHKKSYQFWGPVIALFTGMRLEEISTLRLSDIRQEDGVWVFDLESHSGEEFKNATARRLVPIHDFLIDDLGLLAYRDRLERWGKERLLYDLEKGKDGKYGKNVSTWFNNRFLKGLGLKDGRKLNFHSFRHTFLDQCKQLFIDGKLIKQVAGHKGKEDITYDRYGKPYPADVLHRELIMKLDFGVDLSHLAESQWSGNRPKKDR